MRRGFMLLPHQYARQYYDWIYKQLIIAIPHPLLSLRLALSIGLTSFHLPLITLLSFPPLFTLFVFIVLSDTF